MYMYMYLSDSWKILISSEAHNSETKIAEFQVLKKHIYITLRKVENFNAVTLHVAVYIWVLRPWSIYMYATKSSYLTQKSELHYEMSTCVMW